MKLRLLLLFVFTSQVLFGQVSLVKDINEGDADGFELVVEHVDKESLNDKLLMVANDGIHGYELWVTDGAETNTFLVSDIVPGPGTPEISELKRSGDLVFFNANDSIHGEEVWRTDGTSAGTVLLIDIVEGETGSFPRNFFDDNGTLFFTANGGLWKSDGTTSGTVLVAETGYAAYFTKFNDELYFLTKNGPTNLWKTDGTISGTTIVASIESGISGGINFPQAMIATDNLLYLLPSTQAEGYELWVSDGTELGTNMVKDIRPGSSSGVGGVIPPRLIAKGDELIFKANGEVGGFELWKSDGTELGTQMVKDISVGDDGSSPSSFCLYQDLVYFGADDDITGRNLWVTDGTETGTYLVKDMNPDNSSSYNGNTVNFLTVWNDSIYFGAHGATIYNHALWVSGGTEQSTRRVSDIPINDDGAYLLNDITLGDNELYFNATSFPTGRELFKYTIPLAASVTLENSPLDCFGDSNASATITVSGGTAPFSFEWNNSDSTGNYAENLTGGFYSVTITDAAGATTISTFSIQQPTQLSADLSSTPSTGGLDNGSVIIDPSGGVSPYTYVWNTTPTQETAEVENLGPGLYTVTLTDANDCQLVDSVLVDFLESNSEIASQLESISIEPNPTSGIIAVDGFILSADLKIKLLSSTGELVYESDYTSISQSRMTFDFGEIPSGLYFVSILQEGYLVFRKVVVQ